MISTRIVCRPFIGRAVELDHLLLRRRQAGDGHGGLVLIGGEPGIGKSRVVREFKERLNRHTATFASSACREFAQKPLGPILEILEQIAKVHSADLAGSTKSERYDLIAGTFARVAAKRTTVAVFEDLHWADIDLMQILLLLVRRAANERLLFVATYRDNELTPSHPLFKWFGQLVREPEVSVVTLSRFSDRELDRLMARALEGTTILKPAIMHAVRERADGNPLFAEELLRNAVDSQRGGFPIAPKALPLSLHALVSERLQECSHDERAFLRRASLFGRDFSVALVCEVFSGSIASTEPALARLIALQLLDAIDAAGGGYRFRHALTRDVVYAEMPEEVVRSLHLAIAQHLETTPAATDAPEVLGHHLWEGGAQDRAAVYFERAGDAAMAVFAYDDAATFYQRAGAWSRAARALIFAGDLDSGLTLYERAVETALALGDIADVVRNRALMAGHLFDGERREAAIALLRATLPIALRGDPSLHVRLRTRLAMTLARDARLDDAWNELLAIDAGAVDPHSDVTGEYHLCASELHALRGERKPWQARFARGVAVYEERGHPGPLQVAHANFAVQALALGETDLARTHHRVACELARTLHFDDQPILEAQVELYAGDLARARRLLEAAGTPSRYLMRAILMQVAVPLAIALGDDRMLEHYFDQRLVADAGPRPFTPTLARVAAAHALALAATNRLGEARMLLARVLASINTAFGMTLPIFAIATLLPERARELQPLLEAAAEPEDDRVGKALLAFVAGDRLDAARRFAEIGWPLHEARCLEMASDVRAAVAIYRRCAAAGELRRIEFGSADNGEGTPLGILTARERQLALQVAAGKPNRAVADTLSIGEKTVEKYLTSIYAKLGLSSRAQLAALVAGARRDAE